MRIKHLAYFAAGLAAALSISASAQDVPPVQNVEKRVLPDARPGVEVMDSTEEGLVLVSFGLDPLLGVAP